jgi:hypothetical protein
MKNHEYIFSVEFANRLFDARTVTAIEELLAIIDPVDHEGYTWNARDPGNGWQPGRLHWIPVGRDRGNAGRIQLAGEPHNPPAERLVNGMEAIIELMRRRELLEDPSAPMPRSPREAVERYFGLPRLDAIPTIDDKEWRRALDDRMPKIREQLALRLDFDKKQKEFTLDIRDRGIGQAPSRVHETLLSLGQTDKAEKPYMIGVFGQGGSSTFFSSKYSIVFSRRAPECLDGDADGVGWSIIKKISPKGRRDPYYAYLAALHDGRVPAIDGTFAKTFEHGVLFRHIAYDFGRGGSAVARTLYYALNHVLFNPVLPYDLYALKTKPDAMYGNAYRLARQTAALDAKGTAGVLDKSFQPQTISASQ